MGSINPDRAVPPPSSSMAMSLGEMHQLQWQLRARCQKCNVQLRADLPMLIKVWGPDMIWWGRQPRCPVWACEGRLRYSARSIPAGSWVLMTEQPNKTYVDMWRSRRRNLREEVMDGALDPARRG